MVNTMRLFYSLLLSFSLSLSLSEAKEQDEPLSLPKVMASTIKNEQPMSGGFGSLIFTSDQQLKEYFQGPLKALSLEEVGLITCTSLCSDERMGESIKKFLSFNKSLKSVICIRQVELQITHQSDFVSILYEILDQENAAVALIKIPSNFFVTSEEWNGKLVMCANQESSWEFFLNSQNLWERHNNKMIQRKMHYYN